MNDLKVNKSGEYFHKENMIAELVEFETEANSINANPLYLEGVRAVIKETEETNK